MPLQDVSDVLFDADFADTFSLVRSQQLISEGGIATSSVPQTVANLIGVIVPDSGRALQRLDAGEKITDAIRIFTTYRLTTGNGPDEADRVTWNGGNYVVVNVRDYTRFGVGFVEAVCDLTDIEPGPTLASTDAIGNQAAISIFNPVQPPPAVNVGGGQIRYAEAAGSPSVSIPANVRTPLTFVVDPTQTNNFLNPPFAGNVSFDGTTITPRPGGIGDFYHVLINLLVTSQVAGGQIRFDIDVGSPAGPTGSDTAGLFNDAGVPERVTGNLYIQVLNYFMLNGAKLFITSSVPISLVNEAVLIECESS